MLTRAEVCGTEPAWVFSVLFVLLFFSLGYKVSLYSARRLALNSRRYSCLCLPRAGIVVHSAATLSVRKLPTAVENSENEVKRRKMEEIKFSFPVSEFSPWPSLLRCKARKAGVCLPTLSTVSTSLGSELFMGEEGERSCCEASEDLFPLTCSLRHRKLPAHLCSFFCTVNSQAL